MHPLNVESSGVSHRTRYNIRPIVGVVLGVLLLCGITAFIVYFTQRKTGSNDSCVSGPGYEAASSYFRNPANKEKVTISSEDFKPIVQACDGNVDKALLCVANYIAYDGTAIEKGGRIPRFAPSPAAQHTVMSGYPVGACVLGGKTGTVYIGANFEFCSRLVETVHGEQCAVHNAAVHGEPSITKLAVNAAPCGVCRQFLVEVGPPESLDVIFCDHIGKFTVSKLSSLIISSFGPKDLGSEFSGQTSLKHTELYPVDVKDSDEAMQQAKQMFKQAYAPYTRMPEGFILKFKEGQTAEGQTIENAAYNPSISAFRGACSLAALKGYKMSDLTDIIYVHSNPPGMVGGGNKCPFDSVRASFKDMLVTLASSHTFPAKKPTIKDVVVALPKNPLLAQGVSSAPQRLPL